MMVRSKSRTLTVVEREAHFGCSPYSLESGTESTRPLLSSIVPHHAAHYQSQHINDTIVDAKSQRNVSPIVTSTYDRASLDGR